MVLPSSLRLDSQSASTVTQTSEPSDRLSGGGGGGTALIPSGTLKASSPWGPGTSGELKQPEVYELDRQGPEES